MNGEAIRRRAGLLVVGLWLLGCDGGEADPTIAKALETKSEMEVAADARAETRRKQAEAAQAAAKAARATQDAELAAAATLTGALPATTEEACDAFVERYDQFMLAGDEKEVLEWWDGHRKKLGEARTKCMVRRSIAVAACSTKALGTDLETLKDVPRKDIAVRVVEACIAAHGKDA